MALVLLERARWLKDEFPGTEGAERKRLRKELEKIVEFDENWSAGEEARGAVYREVTNPEKDVSAVRVYEIIAKTLALYMEDPPLPPEEFQRQKVDLSQQFDGLYAVLEPALRNRQ
jgi:hypothetical protein